MLAFVRGVGRLLIDASESSGFGLRLTVRALASSGSLFTFRRMRTVLDLLFQYSVIALPVTALVSLVIGMILAIGLGVIMADYGQEYRIGWVVTATVVREMGPLMTAFILAASLGSGVAAEIGTMKVSEEIDALEVMSISPVKFLILPRLLALILVTPVMTVLANYIAVIGGALISRSQFDVSFTTYQLEALDALAMKDVNQSLVKAVAFGVIIAIVGCSQGLLTEGGATGVGSRTRRSVVVSFLLVLVVSYILSWAIYR